MKFHRMHSPMSIRPLGVRIAKTLGLVLLMSCFVSPASADVSWERIEAIRSQMDKGQALFLAGKYPEAAAVFERGYETYPYSAFLFNAGVAYEKAKAYDLAVERFRRYLELEPNAPDAADVRERVEQLETKIAPGGGSAPDNEPEESDAAEGSNQASVMKALILVETEPQGAPLSIYARVDPKAAPFLQGAPNTGWVLTQRGESPLSLALAVGRYHVVVDRFKDFNVSEADIDVLPGHVHHFKANLSQGAFMAFLRVTSNVEGAYIFLEKPGPKTSPWGRAPYGELVPSGKQTVWVEAPGYEPQQRTVELNHGQQQELEIRLKRVSYGLLKIRASCPAITVEVDGISQGQWRRGQIPLELQLAAGTHLVRIEAEDRKSFEGFVVVPAGQILPIRAVMQETYPRTAAWTQAVLAAAALGGATYLGLESNRLHDELSRDARAGILDAEDGRIVRGRWFAIGADAGFVLGGTLGILATYNFIRDPLPESRIEASEPVEFEDPREPPKPKTLTKAISPTARRSVATPVHWFVGSAAADASVGLSVGGRF